MCFRVLRICTGNKCPRSPQRHRKIGPAALQSRIVELGRGFDRFQLRPSLSWNKLGTRHADLSGQALSSCVTVWPSFSVLLSARESRRFPTLSQLRGIETLSEVHRQPSSASRSTIKDTCEASVARATMPGAARKHSANPLLQVRAGTAARLAITSSPACDRLCRLARVAARSWTCGLCHRAEPATPCHLRQTSRRRCASDSASHPCVA